nr:unnamed protein product [Haemonchus contortus]
MIIEIRASIMDNQREDSVNFQLEMRAAIAQLKSSLDSALAAIEQHQRATPAAEHMEKNIAVEERSEEPIHQDQQSRHPSPAPEDVAMQEQEQEAIQESAEFLEEIRPEEAASGEEREEDREGAHARIRRQYAQMCRRIVQKIQELEQSRANLRQIIEDSRRQPTCPPRRYGYGALRSDTEQLMTCAFCRAVGRHYSDSCDEVVEVSVRRQMIDEREACEECLEHCRRGKRCPKYYVRCYHCGKYDHHSALCGLPDESEVTTARLARARHSLAEATERIGQLQEDLRLYQD